MSNKNRVYKIGGYDISKFVTQHIIGTGLQSKPEWGAFPETPRLNFDLISVNGEFSTLSNNSLLKGVTLKDTVLEVLLVQGSTENLEWKGFIENAIEDINTDLTHITGMSAFSKLLDQASLLTTGINTPSQLSRLIFEAFGISVDEASYNKSNSVLSNLVSVQVDPNLLESRITLMEIQKQLAIAGFARIYFVNGIAFYETFSTDSPTITFDLNERDLMSNPVIVSEERSKQPYKVSYLFGEETSPSFVSGEPAQTLDFGPNAPIKITSQPGAIAVADKWEEIDKIQTRRLPFAVKNEVGNMLSLDSFITLTYDRVNMFQEPLEIIQVDRTDPRYTVLTGRTLP